MYRAGGRGACGGARVRRASGQEQRRCRARHGQREHLQERHGGRYSRRGRRARERDSCGARGYLRRSLARPRSARGHYARGRQKGGDVGGGETRHHLLRPGQRRRICPRVRLHARAQGHVPDRRQPFQRRQGHGGRRDCVRERAFLRLFVRVRRRRLPDAFRRRPQDGRRNGRRGRGFHLGGRRDERPHRGGRHQARGRRQPPEQQLRTYFEKR